MPNTSLPPIAICCPVCLYHTHAAAALGGQFVSCPQCERRIQVPRPEDRPQRVPEPSDSSLGNVVSPLAHRPG